MIFNQNKKENNTGFTLIETMVAITIMMMAITSPIVLAKQGMISARQARNSITAFYIAQDAIEYIRNVRDTNLLSGQYWLNNLDDCVDLTNGDVFCEVNTLKPVTTAFDTCSVNCPEIYKRLDINGNFEAYDYEYDDNDMRSGFSRNVKIITVSPEEVRVEVNVLWEGGRSFEVSEILKKLTP